MRILLAVPWDQAYGGVASVVAHLARWLLERGHDVELFHPGPSDRPTRRRTALGFDGWECNLRAPYAGVHPIRGPLAFTVHLPRTVARVRAWVAERGYDIVNVHYPLDEFAYFALTRRLVGHRLVTSVHGADLLPEPGRPRRLGPCTRLLLRESDALTAPSDAFRREVEMLYPHLAGRIRPVHNGVDFAELDGIGGRAAEPAPYLLTVAAHNPKKGLDVLLRAFDLVAPAYPSLRLLLVGDGPLRGALEAQATASPARDRIVFLGPRARAELVPLLRGCEAFVLASRHEPFGIAAAEALALGRPVIASAVGGLPEFIDAGRTGMLVPPDDPDALATALRHLLADPAAAERLGRAGAEAARAHLDVRASGARYEALFAELMEGR